MPRNKTFNLDAEVTNGISADGSEISISEKWTNRKRGIVIIGGGQQNTPGKRIK